MQVGMAESTSGDYLQRTEWNARDSDGTVIFSLSPTLTGGSLKTQVFATKHKKPCAHIHLGMYIPEASLLRFIEAHSIKALNIAGPRASKEPKIYDFVFKILDAAFFPQSRSLLSGPDEG